jgi:hypothetical protein
MRITRKKSELIITIPDDLLSVLEIQELLDYLKFKSITTKSKATSKDVKTIANEIDNDWWKKNKKRLVK